MDRISRLTYSAGRFFNAAMIGRESREAAKAGNEARLASAAPDYDGFNELVARVQRGTAELLAVDEHDITVFHNTTAAVERVIQRVSQEMHYASATLLTSDLEYPGILAHLDEAWPGRVAYAKVAPLLWRGEAARIADRLCEAVLLARPDVVYLSHVARSSGFCLPDRVIEFITQINPRAIIIVDGAQALGNVVVPPTMLRRVAFYVACGQKWLGGRPALGLVYAKPEWGVPDPAQSYSKRSGSGGTGSVDALGSLGAALNDFLAVKQQTAQARAAEIDQHNASLALELCSRLDGAAQLVALPNLNGRCWRHNGIVAVMPADPAMVARLTAQHVKCSVLHQEPLRTYEGGTNRAPRFDIEFDNFANADPIVRLCQFRHVASAVPLSGVVRLSLHHYHGSREVAQLARWLRGD